MPLSNMCLIAIKDNSPNIFPCNTIILAWHHLYKSCDHDTDEGKVCWENSSSDMSPFCILVSFSCLTEDEHDFIQKGRMQEWKFRRDLKGFLKILHAPWACLWVFPI